MIRYGWALVVPLSPDLLFPQVAETYSKALETINPKKSTANFNMLYINFAKFYEEGGTSKTAQPNLDSARRILEKATKVNFKTVDDLAEIWCEWAEMELRNEYVVPHVSISELIYVLQELRRSDSGPPACCGHSQEHQNQLSRPSALFTWNLGVLLTIIGSRIPCRLGCSSR